MFTAITPDPKELVFIKNCMVCIVFLDVDVPLFDEILRHRGSLVFRAEESEHSGED